MRYADDKVQGSSQTDFLLGPRFVDPCMSLGVGSSHGAKASQFPSLASLHLDEEGGGGRSWCLEHIRGGSPRFLVHRHSGKISQTLGWMEQGQYYLSVPEGLFLLESGRAKLVDSPPLELADMEGGTLGVLQQAPQPTNPTEPFVGLSGGQELRIHPAGNRSVSSLGPVCPQ